MLFLGPRDFKGRWSMVDHDVECLAEPLPSGWLSNDMQQRNQGTVFVPFPNK